MKKSYFTRFICLAVAGLALCSAIAAAAVSGSPYETLKRSVFDLVQTENLTVKSGYELYLDGELVGESSELTLQGDKSTLNITNDRISYSSEEFTLSSWNGYDDGETWYNAQAPGYQRYGGGFIGSDIPDTYSRFAELLLDIVVGDLKNNVSMSRNGDIRSISGTLTAAQIPELYNAAADLLITQSASRRVGLSYNEVVSFDYAGKTCVTKDVYLLGVEKISEYYEHSVRAVSDPNAEGYNIEYGGKYYNFDSWNLLNTEAEQAYPEDYAGVYGAGAFGGLYGLTMPPPASGRLTYIHGDASVDSDGRLMDVSGTVSMDLTDIFGAKHVVEIVFSMEISDIGTTNPECPVEGVPELLARYTHEDARYSSVRFKLDPDGAIDASSVFDNMAYDGVAYTMEKTYDIVTGDEMTEIELDIVYGEE